MSQVKSPQPTAQPLVDNGHVCCKRLREYPRHVEFAVLGLASTVDTIAPLIIRQHLGLNSSDARTCLKNLLDRKYVKSFGKNSGTRYTVTQAGKDILAQMAEFYEALNE